MARLFKKRGLGERPRGMCIGMELCVEKQRQRTKIINFSTMCSICIQLWAVLCLLVIRMPEMGKNCM